MAKKDFTSPALDFLTQKGTPQEDSTHQEDIAHRGDNTHQEDSTPTTHRGHKEQGRRLHRFNLALPVERIKYLQLVSRIDGVSVTEYINQLVLTDQASRAGELERAKEFLKGAE